MAPTPKNQVQTSNDGLLGQSTQRRESRRVSLTETSFAIVEGGNLADMIGHQNEESAQAIFRQVALVSYPRVVIYALGLASVGVLTGYIVSEWGPWLIDPEETIDVSNSTCSEEADGIERMRGKVQDVSKSVNIVLALQVSDRIRILYEFMLRL